MISTSRLRLTQFDITLERVSRIFGDVPALASITLTVERGETVVLHGANGAGKTTLLRILATALTPSFGSGRVLGFDLRTERHEIRRRCALASHSTRLYEDLTATENLQLWCDLHGVGRPGVPGALERVGLREAEHERVRGFSRGMRQRLALARFFLRDPSLLLLDEPTMGLDADGRLIVDELLKRAAGDGRTVILATHQHAPTTAHRIITLERGRLARDPA